MKRTIIHIAFLFAFCITLNTLAIAQNAAVPVPVTGIPAYNSFSGGPDVINNGNLNINFTIPVINKPGRAGLNATHNLVYDSSIWYPADTSGSQVWSFVPQTTNNLVAGWQGLNLGTASFIQYGYTYMDQSCYNGDYWHSWQSWGYGPFYYFDTSGVGHLFNVGWTYLQNSDTSCGPPTGFEPNSNSIAVQAGDNSGYTLYTSPSYGGNVTAYVVDKNGKTIQPPIIENPQVAMTEIATDTNGNYVSILNGIITDTLGQTALTAVGNNPSTGPTTLSYTSPSGATATYTVSYKQYTVRTNFGCSGIQELGATPTYLVDKVTLPDNTTYYQFNYTTTPGDNNSPHNVDGRIASITLPTGGKISYTYTGGSNGIVCADGTAAGLTRTVNPGGTWTYSRNTSYPPVTTITDPQSNQQKIQFVTSTDTGNYNFYPSQAQYLNSSSQQVSKTITCYNGDAYPNCTTQFSDAGISSFDQHNFDANSVEVSEIQKIYAGANLEEQDVSGLGMSETRQTIYSEYNTCGQPGVVLVTNGGANTYGETFYTYDGATPATTTNTPNHTNPPSTSARCNLTGVTQLIYGPRVDIGNPSGPLLPTFPQAMTKSYAYNDTGTLYSSTDANGAVTTYTYSSAGTSPNTASCGNSFPTTVTGPAAPTSLTNSSVYNCVGGVATSTIGANGHTSTVAYTDPLYWRPYSTTDASSNTTIFTYTTTTTDGKLSFGSSVVDKLSTRDTMGRTILSQTNDSTAGEYITTQTNYDSLGRAYQTSMPFDDTASNKVTSGVPLTTTTFDAAGRVSNVTDANSPAGTVAYTYSQNDVLQVLGPAPSGEIPKKKQIEYDPLGRVSSVCEITAGTSTWPGGTCAQTNPATGYYTTYAYDTVQIGSNWYTRTTVTQNAQAASGSRQTRTYVYDLLGRLIQETNPENGTTNYTYDQSSSCNGGKAYYGDLVMKVDNKNNTTCYAYDGLHRNTSITYSDGTPSKFFVYDAATVNSVTMLNAKAQLAEAYTGSSSSKTTDIGFSYSNLGALTDVYEKTPNSTTYYHTIASYWANGALNTLSSNITGLPIQTYGVDSVGRAYSVTASGTGQQKPVTSTAYVVPTNPSSTNLYTTTVTYGSLDSDVFKSDGLTGRQKSYTFKVGSTPSTDTGTTTWNSNGTLQQLSINDGISLTTDSQTCNYVYDDLGRLAGKSSAGWSTDCGASQFQQTVKLDPFGNIVKTGSFPFTPTYNLAKNQVNNLSFTYDANGNTTYDGTNHYTWDAENRMLTAGSSYSATTYDALGRMVEVQTGASAYKQIVYSPAGKKMAVMNATALVQGFVPLPGGGTAVYGPPSGTTPVLAYYRHVDHLGSSRLATTTSRQLYSSTAYGPYGEPYDQVSTRDVSFTGADEDTMQGMNDFLYRKYTPSTGRWLSPDPSGLKATSMANPQSWNRYAYVMNNPMVATDPNGLDCVYLNDDGTGLDEDGVDTNSDPGQCQDSQGIWVPGTFNGVGYTSQDDGTVVGLNSTIGAYGFTSELNGDDSVSSVYVTDAVSAGAAMVVGQPMPGPGVSFDDPLTEQAMIGMMVDSGPAKGIIADTAVLILVGGASQVADTVIDQVLAGAGDSELFGTAYYGCKGICNGNPYLRIGGTYNEEEDALMFGAHGGRGADSWHWDFFRWWP